MHAALRGAEARLAEAVAAAGASAPSPGLEGLDAEALQGLAHAQAILAAALERIAQSLSEVEREFGPPGSSQSAAADAAGSGSGPALRGGAALGAYLSRAAAAAAAALPAGGGAGGSAPRRRRGSGAGEAAGGAAGGAAEAAAGKLRDLELELPQLRYLDLVKAVKAKDATGLVDALHRYFDVAGGGGAAGAAAAAAGAAGAAGGEAAKGAPTGGAGVGSEYQRRPLACSGCPQTPPNS
jgi:hypothetical protein